MRPVVATRMAGRLEAMGLDPKNLPPLEQLDPARKRKLMKTFSDSLGVPCVGCHATGDFAADTRRKRVAKRMYNEIVRVLEMENGDPVFCDSCHQGVMFSLDRRDHDKLSSFMSDVFVDRLRRVDGRDHDCGTCHGDPPEFSFLAEWKSAPAPIWRARRPPPPRPPRAAAAVDLPAEGTVSSDAPPPARPPARKRAPAKVASACGDKKNPCPLQAWMRKNVATAVAAKDTAKLARALDRVATFSPDPSWSWAEMSRVAADAARRGDMAEARKSCQGCHHAYKREWVDTYRRRPVR